MYMQLVDRLDLGAFNVGSGNLSYQVRTPTGLLVRKESPAGAFACT